MVMADRTAGTADDAAATRAKPKAINQRHEYE
jgi:hypothetical protein